MGIVGGHWLGRIVRLPGDVVDLDELGSFVVPPGRVSVLFGEDAETGITMALDEGDPGLIPSPDLRCLVELDRRRRADAPNLDEPIYPEGSFSEGVLP
jgi:hypothetical protein